MYTLTLSQSERAAIDFVGGRYWNGHELYSMLMGSQATPDDADWDDERDITFHIDEPTAWEINEKLEDEGLTLFSDDLCHKIFEFASKIV